jgi:hypothetical protein
MVAGPEVRIWFGVAAENLGNQGQSHNEAWQGREVSRWRRRHCVCRKMLLDLGCDQEPRYSVWSPCPFASWVTLRMFPGGRVPLSAACREGMLEVGSRPGKVRRPASSWPDITEPEYGSYLIGQSLRRDRKPIARPEQMRYRLNRRPVHRESEACGQATSYTRLSWPLRWFRMA